MKGARARLGAASIAVVSLLTGCTNTAAHSSRKSLTVFAASSLTESFTTLAHRFEASHPVHVVLVFGPSQELARQIAAGATADVYAAASSSSVEPLTRAGLTASKPVVFARNRLQLIVPAGNPGHIEELRDIGRVKFAQCAVEVPCGAATERLLARFDLAGRVRPATYERDVKAVLQKVKLGEVDAGIVYATDLRAESRRSGPPTVAGVQTPPVAEATTDCPAVVVKHNSDTTAANAFVEFLVSAAGRSVLADAGFDAP
jgi:molybdate transport system substrate-binding protein